MTRGFVVHSAEGGAKMPFPDAQKKLGKKLITNRFADKLLVESRSWNSLRGSFPTWTGTVIAYPKAGEAFGDTVSYTDTKDGKKYVFHTRDFRGERNCAIMIRQFGLVHENDFLVYVSNDHVILQAF